jgi:hypothetical protein
MPALKRSQRGRLKVGSHCSAATGLSSADDVARIIAAHLLARLGREAPAEPPSAEEEVGQDGRSRFDLLKCRIGTI